MTITKNLNEEVPEAEARKIELRELMEKNVRLTEEMHAMMKNMEKFIFWSRVSGYLKFIFIVLPLILSFFLFKDIISQYQSFFGENQGTGLPDLLKLIPSK